MRRWRFPRKDIIELVTQSSYYPLWTLCGPIINQRSAEYTHFIRIGCGTKSVEIGLTDEDARLPIEQLRDRFILPLIERLTPSLDPAKFNILAAG